MKRYVLGLDLSMNRPGFAVVRYADGKMELLETSHIDQDTRRPHAHRLAQTASEIMRYLTKYPITEIVREKGFSKHNTTTQTLFKVVGVSDFVAYRERGFIIEELSPGEVRKLITGKGKIPKSEAKAKVQTALEKFVGKWRYKSDDESDATAVAVAYLLKTG